MQTDGDCDDTRFGGDRGSNAIGDDSHIKRDATDCRNLLNEGSIFPLPSGTASIAGFVWDFVCSSVPGVTIEVSSPALNGQVRAVYSNGDGGYAVRALPTGTYAVTFRSPGFTSFRHESVEVTMGLTTTVNAELEIGISERLITVSGEIVAGRCQNEQ